MISLIFLRLQSGCTVFLFSHGQNPVVKVLFILAAEPPTFPFEPCEPFEPSEPSRPKAVTPLTFEDTASTSNVSNFPVEILSPIQYNEIRYMHNRIKSMH